MRTSRLMLLAAVPVLVVLAGCKQKTASDAVPAGPAGQLPGGAAPTAPAPGGEVRVYVPCGMIGPMRAVALEYMKQNPNAKIVGVYDNAGVIVKRLRDKHERADLIVSPGSAELGALDKAGLVKAGTTKVIGDFELVCIVPRDSTLGIARPEDLKKVKTMGSPDVEKNSVGVSGREALTKLGLWDTLKPRMIFTEHAIQAYTMVAGGKADAAVCYRNCPLETNPEKLAKSRVRIAFSFPKDSYTRQECLIAQMKDAANGAAAEAYVQFMTSPAGLKVMSDNGMTGCLDLGNGTAPAAGTAGANSGVVGAPDAPIKVVAYYPGNEEHAFIRKGILALPAKHGKQVSAEFVDFTDEAVGYPRAQKDGMNCGGILINGEQTFLYDKGGKPYEVSFKMREGGEWTWADLDAVLKQQLKKQK